MKEIKVDMPRKLLPKGAREGSWLKVSFKLDPRGEQGQREKIEAQLQWLRERNK